MPFPATLRDRSPARDKRHYLRDQTDKIRSRMSTLLLQNRGSPTQPRRNILAGQSQRRAERTINISDDDDSDDELPPPNPHRRTQAKDRVRTSSFSRLSDSSPDPVSSDDSPMASDSSSLLASEDSEFKSSSPAHKRVKVRHQIPGRHLDRLGRQQTPLRRPAEPTAEPERTAAPRNQGDVLELRKRPTAPVVPITSEALSAQLDDEPRQPPYYFDAKLESRMYRGPGYDFFPVALGTVDGHQEKCDEWDAIVAVETHKAQRGLPPLREAILVDKAHPEDDEETEILGHVLDVLPDVERNFALKKIREHLAQFLPANTHYLNHHLAAGDIVSLILDAESYPQELTKASHDGKREIIVDETGMTILWDKSLVKNGSYLKDAVVLLSGQFPHVPTHYIFRVVHDKISVFDSYIHINNIDNKYYQLSPRPYHRSRNPRTILEKKYATRNQHEKRDSEKFLEMVNELQAAKQTLARESLKLEKQREKDNAEAANLEAHKQSGDIVECKCCFDDEIPMNRAVACQGEQIHFFCFGCVNQLADTQIGVMKYEMVCMDGDGCKAQLSNDGIGQAVPIKTFDRLAFNQQQAEIAAAGIEGLEQCPFCDFKGICGPVEEERVFNCQNPDCSRATCRLCKEDVHVPKTCEEAKVDKGLSARHVVEEARTEAMLRSCPKCKVKIIKEHGCNKIMCNQCHCIMCYVCKADISNGKEGGYEHFNKPGAKCKLYETAGRQLHDEDADAAEEQAIKQAKADDAELDEKLLRIETSRDGKRKDKSHNALVAPLLPPAPVYFGMPLNGGQPGGLLNNPPPARNLLGAPDLVNMHAQMEQQARMLREQIHQMEAVMNQPARQRHVTAAADGRRQQQEAVRVLANAQGRQMEALGRQMEAQGRQMEAQGRQQEALRASQQAAANRPANYPGPRGFILPALQAVAPIRTHDQPGMQNHWALPDGAHVPPNAPMQVNDANGWDDVDDGLGDYDDGLGDYDDGLGDYDDGLGDFDDGLGNLEQLMFGGANNNGNARNMPGDYPMDRQTRMH